ncbi:glycosyltransferase [Romboutsia sp.]|uniref:glycosyltransferase n=1 Tax=Romboutsia sp. TaxID=1965302 RepID=UPI003F3A038C
MKKRVLHLLSSNSLSGAESVAINIIKSLEDEYEFVYVSPKGQIEYALKEKKINYIPLDNISPYSLNKLFNEWKPDVVHAHDFRASIKTALSLYKCKKISHLHQNPSWIKYINKYSIAYTSTCFAYDNILTVSSQIREEAIFSKLVKNKIKKLENCINRDDVIRKSKLDDNNDIYDVVYIGRLAEEKDPLRFIKIIKEVKNSKPNIKVALVGEGLLLSECETLIQKFKLESNIEMLGFLNNPYSIMKKSKILVMTSKWEGFGLVAVEAMILGKPVLASPVGGLKSIVTQDFGGLCSTNDEYVNRITNLLINLDEYEIKSKNATQYSKKFTDIDRYKSELRQIYIG